MLSTLSPIRARKSMISSGPTPNFSFTPSTSRRLPVMVLTSVMCPSTSCAMSLSPVEITTGRPAAALLRARVPITSSASTPSTHSNGRPRARTLACSGSTWTRRSSGIDGRLALYSANSSSRKVGPLASKTTANGLSGYCLRRLRSMFSTPFTAPVGLPVEVVSGGRAWKARYRYEEPSTRTRGAWLMRGINLFRRPGRVE